MGTGSGDHPAALSELVNSDLSLVELGLSPVEPKVSLALSAAHSVPNSFKGYLGKWTRPNKGCGC